MQTRTRDRLRLLEAKIAPKPRAFVFFSFSDADDPAAPSRDERLAAFKVERAVTPSDIIHTVTVTFA